MSLVDLLGDVLVTSDGREVPTDGLLSNHCGGVIGVYFSALWCGPCGRFTPKLASVYNKVKGSGQFFEIVFVSFDTSEVGRLPSLFTSI